jgi:pimeloyl-ACP methyl ester carboxylesterase
MNPAVEEHIARTDRHTTFFLASGPAEGTPIIFLHGWPGLAIGWRHQLACLSMLGFRAIAPDMRGYGRSSTYTRHEDYARTESVQDMLELLDQLGLERALWVGHDWGGEVVWSLANHHPERCIGIANLCVPYIRQAFAPVNIIPLVDRTIYPESEFPAGQWEYMLFYEEHFDDATRAFDANPTNFFKALYRRGRPDAKGTPGRLAYIRRNGGWFGPHGQAAPDVPLDTDVLTTEDLDQYATAFARTGFFGANSWYMNHARNVEYARSALNGGKIDLPVLFLHGEYDYTCETVASRLAEPMRADCSDLTEAIVQSGHWMPEEKPLAVNSALVRWLATRFPELWRGSGLVDVGDRARSG